MIVEYPSNDWRRRFAILPVFFRNGSVKTMIWWQWYWAMDCGEYRAIRLNTPNAGGDND